MTKCIIYSKPPVLFHNKRPSVLWFDWVCLWWPENLITWQMVLGEELVFLEVSSLALFSILSVLSHLASATFDAKVKSKVSVHQGHSLHFPKSDRLWGRACTWRSPGHRRAQVREAEARWTFIGSVETRVWMSASQSPDSGLHSLRCRYLLGKARPESGTVYMIYTIS